MASIGGYLERERGEVKSGSWSASLVRVLSVSGRASHVLVAQ